ncbi:MAG TPA: fumarylacetoacetase [Acidimicrobiales bacterium]|nr:fumarylacetoacetase [Acidimicrobiales bacterium]
MPDGFGLENLPFGVCRQGDRRFAAVRLGDAAADLDALQRAGGLSGVDLPDGVFSTGTLNDYLALGPEAWGRTRARLQEADLDGVAVALDDVEMVLPIEVADYADFYSSEHHARNMGLILRPDTEPLLPNWKRLPVGYHGRAGTVVVSGTPIVRPRGLVAGTDGEPEWRPTRVLDIELEVGSVVGVGSEPGARIRADDADRHVFGFVLLDDWSARDIQAFEYQPLGPFLAKSFATSISPWIVTLDAVRPFLVAGEPQLPEPAPYLRAARPWHLDLDLAVDLNGSRVTCTSFRYMYWSFAQQLAHVTGNGARARTGDLLGSGTVSGPEPGTRGSLMEMTWRGRDPLTLSDGTTRTFLEDGDTVVLHGRCGGPADTRGWIDFGDCAGTVEPAEDEPGGA